MRPARGEQGRASRRQLHHTAPARLCTWNPTSRPPSPQGSCKSSSIPATASSCPSALAHVQSLRSFFTLQSTPPYVGGGLHAAILLSDLHEPTGWRLAQRRELRLRCEPSFRPMKAATATSRSAAARLLDRDLPRQFVAWFDVARSFGMRVEVFAHAMYVHLHLNLNSCTSISPRATLLTLCSPPTLAAFSCRWPSRSERAPPVWCEASAGPIHD